MNKYKPGDLILYKHPDDVSHHIGKILSLGDEDNYWIEWQSENRHITKNTIYEIDNDKNLHPYSEASLILFGASDDR